MTIAMAIIMFQGHCSDSEVDDYGDDRHRRHRHNWDFPHGRHIKLFSRYVFFGVGREEPLSGPLFFS